VKRLSVALALAVLASLTVMVDAAPAHNAPNRCGHQRQEGAGWFRAFGHDVTCKKARAVARRWAKKCSLEFCRENQAVQIHVWPGYSCRYRDHGYETVRVKCTAEGDRIVHFLWGS
jgi:hypothetical protein